MQEYILFNEDEYISRNKDLEKYSYRYTNRIIKREKLWRHWCVFGKHEKRSFPSITLTNTVSKEYFENNYIIYITRNIIDHVTEEYWRISYNKIRKYYRSIKIIIIDDNSDKTYINDDIEDVEYIYTEYLGRGELLPYYYYLKDNRGKKFAIMLHDSLFLENKLHKYIVRSHYTPLWHFFPEIELRKNRINIENILSDNKYKNVLIDTFDNRDWRGVFGSMSIISHELLRKIEKKMNIFDSLITKISNREDRKALERVFSLIFRYMNIDTYSSLLGNIHHWCRGHYGKYWEVTLDEYKKSSKDDECLLTKIWTGR